MGKWETLTGEGGFGMYGVVDFGMIGAGERDQIVRRIVMNCFVGGEVKWGRMAWSLVLNSVSVSTLLYHI